MESNQKYTAHEILHKKDEESQIAPNFKRYEQGFNFQQDQQNLENLVVDKYEEGQDPELQIDNDSPINRNKFEANTETEIDFEGDSPVESRYDKNLEINVVST